MPSPSSVELEKMRQESLNRETLRTGEEEVHGHLEVRP